MNWERHKKKQAAKQRKSSTLHLTPNELNAQRLRRVTKKKVRARTPSERSLSRKERLNKAGFEKFIAIDCEFVGTGSSGRKSELARVSIVDSTCQVVFDSFVSPLDEIKDYRSHVSGIHPGDLDGAPSYRDIQQQVHDIMKDKVIVGHSLTSDLKALKMSHPRAQQRDSAAFSIFLRNGRPQSLKALTEKYLHKKIQTGEHCSVEDAKSSMQIFLKFCKQWESAASRNEHYENTMYNSKMRSRMPKYKRKKLKKLKQKLQ
ncbi:hypothetical protein PCE1_000187 [Barthelona sp. PCE]